MGSKEYFINSGVSKLKRYIFEKTPRKPWKYLENLLNIFKIPDV